VHETQTARADIGVIGRCMAGHAEGAMDDAPAKAA